MRNTKRGTGKTFRMLLRAIIMTSELSDEKKGVIVYCANIDYTKKLFNEARQILSIFGFEETKNNSKAFIITMPNDKTIEFRSMIESADQNRGINWRLYDELSDHYVPNDVYVNHIVNKRIRDAIRNKSFILRDRS